MTQIDYFSVASCIIKRSFDKGAGVQLKKALTDAGELVGLEMRMQRGCSLAPHLVRHGKLREAKSSGYALLLFWRELQSFIEIEA